MSSIYHRFKCILFRCFTIPLLNQSRIVPRSLIDEAERSRYKICSVNVPQTEEGTL